MSRKAIFLSSVTLHHDEIFKDVVGYEGLYQVSNYGRIISTHRGQPKIVKTEIIRTGYESVKLQKNKKQFRTGVHRLVASAFLETYGEEVNHKDGNKLNNHVSNLEWVTSKDNISHSILSGLKQTKNKPETIKSICEFLSNPSCSNYSYSDVSEKFNITKENLESLINRRTWKDISKNYPTFYPLKTKNKKLTDEEFEKICVYIKNNNQLSNSELSKRLNIDRNYIRRIRNGNARKEISKKYF